MSDLIEIKKRIASISSTIKVTKVMHMIAASKIAKVKQKIVAVDKYDTYANKIMGLYLKNTLNKQGAKKYITDRGEHNDNKSNKQQSATSASKDKLYILFSSDKGTCGAVNTNLFKEMTNILAQDKSSNNKVVILPIGKKAYQFALSNRDKLGFDVVDVDGAICAEQFDSDVISSLVAKVVEAYDNGKFGSVELVFQKYKNIITCYPVKQTVLPFVASELTAGGDTKDKEANGAVGSSEDEKYSDFINIDEDDKTIKSVVEFFVKTKLQVAYISNLASIFSSRMNAMDNATKNGQEIIDDLLIKYNKGRQSHITSELSDIVSGFEAIS